MCNALYISERKIFFTRAISLNPMTLSEEEYVYRHIYVHIYKINYIFYFHTIMNCEMSDIFLSEQQIDTSMSLP
jgi:CMP-2-keto-3-deoxyoctulosonic acid synthetase